MRSGSVHIFKGLLDEVGMYGFVWSNLAQSENANANRLTVLLQAVEPSKKISRYLALLVRAFSRDSRKIKKLKRICYTSSVLLL